MAWSQVCPVRRRPGAGGVAAGVAPLIAQVRREYPVHRCSGGADSDEEEAAGVSSGQATFGCCCSQ